MYTVCNQHSEAAKRGLDVLRPHRSSGSGAGGDDSSPFLSFLRANGTLPAGESQWLHAAFVQARSQFPFEQHPQFAATWWKKLSPLAGGWMPQLDNHFGVASDAWAAAWMGMWVDGVAAEQFVCGDGVRKLLANPAWQQAANGSHLAASVGGCFATAMATQAFALCPSLANATERAAAAQAYMQSRWGVWLPAAGGDSSDAYFFNTTGCDNHLGHPLVNTGTMLLSTSGGALPLRQLLLHPPSLRLQQHRLLRVQVDGAFSVAVLAAHASAAHLNFTLARSSGSSGTTASGDGDAAAAPTVTAVCKLGRPSGDGTDSPPQVTVVGWANLSTSSGGLLSSLSVVRGADGGRLLNVTLPSYVFHGRGQRVRVVVHVW